MEGMVTKEIVKIQNKVEDKGRCKLSVNSWSAGFVMKLLEVTHGQWLYRNVHVHDIIRGEKAMKRKEFIRKELESQIELGGDGLEEEDLYLLDINLEDLDHSSGEDQTYWLMALQTAWEAKRIREELATTTTAGSSEGQSGI